MKKGGALVCAAVLVMSVCLTACKEQKVTIGATEQTTQMDAYKNGTSKMVLGEVTFEVPSDWKAEENQEGRLVAVATDDAGTDVAFTFTYTEAEEPIKNHDLVDQTLENGSAIVGYPADQWKTTGFQDVKEAKTGTYTYTVDGVTYDETGIAIPIGGKGCLVIRKTIVDGDYDAFQNDYDYIVQSIKLPEKAGDDHAAGLEYSSLYDASYTLPSGTGLSASVAENDEDDTISYLYELSGDDANTLSCDTIYLYLLVTGANQTTYRITTHFGDLTATVSPTERSGVNKDGSIVEMGFPDWLNPYFEQTAEGDQDVMAMNKNLTEFFSAADLVVKQ